MDPEFPLSILDYAAKGDEERIHWHHYLQIVLCTGGSGKFIFTNREYPVSPGDIFIVSDFENHVALAEPGKQTDYIFMIFLPSLIASPGCRQFDFEYLYPFYYNPKTFHNKIDSQQPIAREIGREIRAAKEIWENRQTTWRHELDASLRKILSLLMKHYKDTYAEYYSPDDASHVKISDAVDFINRNFDRNITVQEVADILHISESAFRALFKENMRMPFKEYITYLRLTKAKKMLLTTDASINEIAAMAGYTNINQFYKVFHKYVFMSPAEYRNSNSSLSRS